jgi:hypothetical protein
VVEISIAHLRTRDPLRWYRDAVQRDGLGGKLKLRAVVAKMVAREEY